MTMWRFIIPMSHKYREMKLSGFLIRIIDETDKSDSLYAVCAGRSDRNEFEWHRGNMVYSTGA